MAIVMTSQSRPNPRTLTTLPEILASLSALESEEAELSASLSTLLSDRDPIIDALTRVQSLVPRLDELHSEATLLSGTVKATAKTADRVGGRVRSLDEEIRRVREAGERVGQVMELKVRGKLLFCLVMLSHSLQHRHLSQPSRPRWNRRTGSQQHATVPERWHYPSTSHQGHSQKAQWSVSCTLLGLALCSYN